MYKKNKTIVYIATILSLTVLLFVYIDYLSNNGYIRERFAGLNNDVNMPLTTTFSCSNMCVNSKCSKTGTQCLSDADCQGCGYGMTDPKIPQYVQNADVRGNNSAGKITSQLTPTYSSLTTDIGTQAMVITSDKFKKPPSPNFGTDLWTRNFIEQRNLFDKRYKPTTTAYPDMLKYPQRYSLSGMFVEEEPLESNAYFCNSLCCVH